MRYQRLSDLGSGGFGTVYKARDPSTGQVFAVKVMTHRNRPGDVGMMDVAERGERIILPQLDHQHIIRSFHSQGWGTRCVEIFMDLMHGTLESLCESLDSPCQVLANHVLHQMLQALDYLSGFRYVHRDVKPDNIFYTNSTFSQYRYHFRLGDFGLCESEDKVAHPRGSMLYMAPEIDSGEPQSHKSDMWALYVTMLWTLDVENFRWVVEARGPVLGGAFAVSLSGRMALDPRTAVLGDMARVDCAERATAWVMLRTFFP